MEGATYWKVFPIVAWSEKTQNDESSRFLFIGRKVSCCFRWCSLILLGELMNLMVMSNVSLHGPFCYLSSWKWVIWHNRIHFCWSRSHWYRRNIRKSSEFAIFHPRHGVITGLSFLWSEHATIRQLRTRIASTKWVLCGHELLGNHPLSRQQGNNQALETDVQASTLQASVVNGHTGRPKVCRPSTIHRHWRKDFTHCTSPGHFWQVSN